MSIIACTIEARMTSTRLPGKVLKPVLGKPMLQYLVDRLKRVSAIDKIVLATTTNASDDILVKFAEDNNINYFRGSENDVMERVIGAGDSVGAEIIVEITSDCPIIDPDIVGQMISIFKANNVDYVSNNNLRSYPDGMDTQVFRLETLKRSAALTNKALDREHVTLHIRQNPEHFSRIDIIAPPSQYWPDLRLTLDEQNDYELIKKIIEYFHEAGQDMFSCKDAIDILTANPAWVEINSSVIPKGDS